MSKQVRFIGGPRDLQLEVMQEPLAPRLEYPVFTRKAASTSFFSESSPTEYPTFDRAVYYHDRIPGGDLYEGFELYIYLYTIESGPNWEKRAREAEAKLAKVKDAVR